MEIAKKNDFIEIEFTGWSNNEVFDTTNKDEAKAMGVEIEGKPMIVSIGNQMILKGFDAALEGKEIGKKYELHLEPEDAFGKRQSKLIKLIPMKAFLEKDIRPTPGMSFNIDDYIVKVLAVSGGRVTVDFNNPLAGRDVNYTFTIKRIVTDTTEKINAFQDFFFKQRFEFEIKDKDVILKKPELKMVADAFGKKFNEITGFNLKVVESEKKEEENKDKLEEKKSEER